MSTLEMVDALARASSASATLPLATSCSSATMALTMSPACGASAVATTPMRPVSL